MKTVALLMAYAGACMAAIGNFSVIGATATQAVIQYDAPDGNPCTIQISQSQNPNFTPPALDVDPGTFANSNYDLSRPTTVTSGLSRIVVLGQRTSQLATAGTPGTYPYPGVRHYSRALQALTPYFGQITCPSTGDKLTFTNTPMFITTNIPLGQTYGDPWLSDPAHPGDQPWPEWIGGSTPESFIDPLTGTLQYRIGTRANNPEIWNLKFGSAFNQGQTTPCDTAGPWTSPCNVTAGSGNTTVGASTATLVLRPFMSVNNPWNTNYGQFWSLDQAGLSLTGYVNSTTTANRVLDVCLSLNGGASCATSVQQMTMGQTSGTQTVGEAPTSIWSTTTQFGVDPWLLDITPGLLDTTPRINSQESSPHSGTATVTNNSGVYTVTNNNTGDAFSLYWVTGGNGSIRLSSNNDACMTPPANTTSSEYRIASFKDGNNIILASGTPPTGSSIYWCEDNFTVMVWRAQAPTDGSTVTLTGAVLNALGSYFPGTPDNGSGTACYNTAIYGGYFCLYGNLFWVNPGDPTYCLNPPCVAYYGQPEAAGVDGKGSPIANSWSRVTAPTPESASIDQTQSQLTFYVIGNDPAGTGPLVIQAVFNPSSMPTQPTVPVVAQGDPQIQNATVVSTTAYSVTWSNGLTLTNMTPQTTMQESVFQQVARFDPTFNPSYYKNFNCGLTGATSLAAFFFACYSQGGDSPAWLFAFSAGDGNPAHAGATGGPQIVGAINTFNTPNPNFFSSWPVAPGQGTLTGRSLHALVEGGDTGWVNITANDYEPLNTSATNVPGSGPEPCTIYGLTGNTHDCILININSHTVQSVTGYEPYFASPSAPFLGTPGELRTTQIGDTACVTTTSAGSCNWSGQVNEMMTLMIKNYASVAGAWVFQRNAYGKEIAVNGPIALWWESFDNIIPPGATAYATGQVFWNPLAGCNGAPDPHGNCMIEDSNATGGHGEWRNGGESAAANVPGWVRPIWGWPFDYQTVVGSVPCILSLPFANLTPNVVTTNPCTTQSVGGVNFVASEPPFAGVYGHPWGFDGGNHPNAAGAHASAWESIRAFDNIPVQGGTNEPTYTPVTGQLYVATPTSVLDADDPFGYGSIVAINRKVMATGASCGSHPLIDLSGPTSSIATDTSRSYTYCIARVGGECYPGSTVGQVYVNCPGVTSTSCAGSGIHGGTPLGVGNDICVGNIGNGADAIIQYTLDSTDYSGASRRALVSATSRLRMVYGFENNALLPDNSWIVYRQEWLNYQRAELWMSKSLPYPQPDSVARWTFVPMILPNLQGPAGTTNALVEFGYQEYGAPQLLNCTTRNDACIATASTVTSGNQPFYFASENPTGAPCASGCTIAIPAISQRVLYYQVVFRAANNSVLSTSTPTAVTVP